jgi:hypothetical protein
MKISEIDTTKTSGWSTTLALKVLNCSQVQRIDSMLDELGPFGELRLIKRKGQLRFIEKVESFDLYEDI